MAASSENLAARSSVDPFLLFLQSVLGDTKALQHSHYYNFDADDDFNLFLPPPPDHSQQHHNLQQQIFSPFSDLDLQKQQQQPNSTLSASDQETATTPKRRVAAAAAKGRIAKRKSRATKKNLTTFIAADPANFRQMVQQVTGVRFDEAAASSTSSSSPLPPLSQLLLKPEPRRPVGRLYSACLPTLDTSSFFLDQRDNHQSAQTLMAGGSIYSSGVLEAAPSYGGGDGGAAYGAADGLVTFPTLESGKVM